MKNLIKLNKIPLTPFKKGGIYRLLKPRTWKCGLLLAAYFAIIIISPAVFAADSVTGTIFDWNGKPVKNAFVMLKENPYRFDLSAMNGSFSINIDGITNAKNLQVSAAGSCVANIPLTTPQTKKLTIKLKQQSPLLSQLEIGCNQATFREKWSCADNRPLTKDQEICVKAYNKFINSKQAETIRNKILTNSTLTKKEEPYRYIVLADIAVKAALSKKNKTDLNAICKQFCVNLVPHNIWVVAGHQEGKTKAGNLLEKAYRGKPLTENDLKTLREMIIVGNFLGAGRKHLAPSFLWKVYNQNHGIGTAMGDVRLLKLESALKHAKYSDYSDLNASTFLRPEALAHYLTIFNHWQEESDGSISPKDIKDFPKYQGYSQKDFITKSDLLGKPTVVFNTSPLEDMTHPPAIAAFIEYLNRAYGDKINVIYIANVSTYHGDMWEDEFLYFGRNPDAKPLEGIDSPALQHETTLESLARVTKLQQMKNPSYSWDIYLDDAGKASRFSMGGSERRDMMLFDKNGKRVCWKVAVGVPEETGANGQNVSSYHTPFYGYYLLEKNLRILLENDGIYDENKMDYTMPNIPHRAMIPGRVFREAKTKSKYPGKNPAQPWHGFCLNVLTVNLEKSEITVESGEFSGSIQKENLKDKIQMTFVVDKDTRIIIKEKEKNFNGRNDPKWIDNYKHGTLNDIVPGDLIRVDFLLDNPPQITDKSKLNLKKNFLNDGPTKPVEYREAFTLFQPKDYASKKNKALRIWNTHTGFGETKVHQQIVFWGEITKINPKNKTIEVKMPRPNGEEIHGYRFWKEAGANADISEDTKPNRYRTAEKLAATRRYVEGTDADRIRTFTIDAGVRISRNGVPEKAFSDFKVGDKVSVFYLPFYESQYTNTIPIYPEVILSSESIE